MFNNRNKEYKDVEMDDFFSDLDEDLSTEIEDVEEDKKDRKFYKFFKGPLALIGVMCLIFSLASSFLFIGGAMAVQAADPIIKIWNNVPSKLPNVVIGERNVIYDKNGGVIAQLWSEDRQPLTNINQISPNAVNALIDTEDANFYKNKGIDYKGTFRSAIKGSGGGSGITQQLIKNLLFYDLSGKQNKKQAIEKSYARKVKELKMAIDYEKNHSKNEILVNYFNTVAFGGPTTYGLETASNYFFNKKAKDLSLAEAAALVGSANNPILFDLNSPDKYDSWKYRQKVVLDSMVKRGHITQTQADNAYNEKLTMVKKKTKGGSCYNSKYPFYCSYVMDYMSTNKRIADTQEERNAILARGGLQIKTYMDPQAMNTINEYMKKNWGMKNRIIAPTAIVQPGTGGVLAVGANREYGFNKDETVINLANQPSGEGSVYKMFTLAAALQEAGWDESQLAFSAPCPLYPGPNYDSPSNGYRNSDSCALQGGYKNYKQATAYSSNTWFVDLEMKIGVNKVKDFSKKVGLAAPDYITNRSLSYTLGSVNNSPINLAAAFATFANKGVYCPPVPVQSINYVDGSSLPIPDDYDPKDTACRSVMSPQNAGIVLKAMRANVSGEVKYAFGLKANIPKMDNGGKSGTNELLNSSWAQVTGYYSLFTNVYDMNNTQRGINGAIFKGYPHSWHENTATETGSDIMKQLSKGKKNIPLNWDDPNTDLIPTTVDESNYFVIPNVTGMKPEEAVSTLKSLGIIVHVSKDFKEAPAGYSSRMVAEQSVPAGTKLPKGTKKEIILYLTK